MFGVGRVRLSLDGVHLLMYKDSSMYESHFFRYLFCRTRRYTFTIIKDYKGSTYSTCMCYDKYSLL